MLPNESQTLEPKAQERDFIIKEVTINTKPKQLQQAAIVEAEQKVISPVKKLELPKQQ